MTDDNDPFAGLDSEYTLIKPKPRVAAAGAAALAPSDAPSPAQLPPLALNFAELPHLNPIVAAASGMLRSYKLNITSYSHIKRSRYTSDNHINRYYFSRTCIFDVGN